MSHSRAALPVVAPLWGIGEPCTPGRVADVGDPESVGADALHPREISRMEHQHFRPSWHRHDAGSTTRRVAPQWRAALPAVGDALLRPRRSLLGACGHPAGVPVAALSRAAAGRGDFLPSNGTHWGARRAPRGAMLSRRSGAGLTAFPSSRPAIGSTQRTEGLPAVQVLTVILRTSSGPPHLGSAVLRYGVMPRRSMTRPEARLSGSKMAMMRSRPNVSKPNRRHPPPPRWPAPGPTTVGAAASRPRRRA